MVTFNPTDPPADASERSLVDAAVLAIQQGTGEKLSSIVLIGPSVQPRRHSKRPELLIIVDDLPVALLANVARGLTATVASGLKLQMLTKRELLRAADVFTLELADYQLRHELLFGSDPFSMLYFTPAEMRSAIERSLRTLSRDTRNSMLACAADDEKALAAIFVENVDKLVVAAFHFLRLLSVEIADDEQQLIQALEPHAKAYPRRLCKILEDTRADSPTLGIVALAELIEVVDQFTRCVDAMGVEAAS